jgi:alkylated DNA repair dioxygenase AlkB
MIAARIISGLIAEAAKTASSSSKRAGCVDCLHHLGLAIGGGDVCIIPMTVTQSELFEFERPGPAGLRYSPEFISASDERALLDAFKRLAFKPFEFHGHLGNRQVASFGWRYDYGQRAVSSAQPIPAFLLPLRARAADFAGLPADEFEQLLVTRYPPGAGIGWHRDKAVFGEVIGMSF